MHNKKKILVCGATGFMGRNIVEKYLEDPNFELYGVGLSRAHVDTNKFQKFYNCDLTTQLGVDHVFKDQQFDIVVQAAANTSGAKDILEKPYLHVTDNAVMNSLILRACFETGVKHFLFLSCGVMYNPDRSPVSETDFYLDEAIHKNYFGVGWTKVYIEKMCEFYAGLGRTKHTVIRHSNTYGPYDKYDLKKSHMFGATIAKVMNAKNDDEIVVWGDGLTERDLIYVDDVVEFIDKAILMQTSNHEIFNVGYGSSFSVKEIVSKIIEHSGKRLKIVHDLSKPSIQTKLSFNSSKALDFFGWKYKTSIDDGIMKTIKWYKNNL